MAERLGLKLPVSMEQRMTGAAKVGEHNTSTLQDLEAGRPLELEAVVGAVLEIGERLDVAMPATRAFHACTKLRASVARRRVQGGPRGQGSAPVCPAWAESIEMKGSRRS
jgi:2-dehydropantoate 2-reductase